jgi:uncharacterized protein YihD (DUF1040 family)
MKSRHSYSLVSALFSFAEESGFDGRLAAIVR